MSAQLSVSLTWTPTPGTTSNVDRNGVQIASGLTTGAYTDTNVTPGSTYNYTVTATDADGTSAPSNTFTAQIPAPAPVATMIGFGTSTINHDLTRVTINVTAVSGETIPQGTVTWSINGNPIYVDTLLSNGRDGQNVWTVLLNSSIPITITYSGNANFAASSATLP